MALVLADRRRLMTHASFGNCCIFDVTPRRQSHMTLHVSLGEDRRRVFASARHRETQRPCSKWLRKERSPSELKVRVRIRRVAEMQHKVALNIFGGSLSPSSKCLKWNKGERDVQLCLFEVTGRLYSKFTCVSSPDLFTFILLATDF